MRFFVFEEVIRAFDDVMSDCDALLLVQFVHQRQRILRRGNLIGTAVDDQARGGAGCQERKVVHICRRGDRDKAGDLWPAHQKLHPDPRAKRKARNPAMLGILVHRLQIIQRTCGI